MRRVVPALAVLVVVVAGALPNAALAGADPSRRSEGAAVGAARTLARELFYRLNDERAARGLRSLMWDGSLGSIARAHSRSMASRGSVHTFQLRAVLVRHDLAEYDTLGENVLGAGAATTTGRIDAAWMGTRHQRNTMLAPGFTSAAVGVVCAPDGRVWASEIFGRTRGSTVPIRVESPAHPVVARLSGSSCTNAAGRGTTRGTPGPPDPANDRAGNARQGLVGGVGFSEGSSLSRDVDRALVQDLDGIAATGATWLRVDVRWPDVEPAPGRFDWGPVDRIVSGARARGLTILATLDYTPGWARPAGTSEKTPPSNPADFARFAAAAARHYATAIHAWEIWNEENSFFFWATGANPKAYTALLVAADNAISAVDPNATVLTGGTSPATTGHGSMAPAQFLEGIYAAGGRGHFDAVAHHAYHWPYLPLDPTPDFNENSFLGVTPRLHAVMAAHGDGTKRIWITEVGAPVPTTTSNGRHTTPAYLAAYVTEAFAVVRAWPWTGPMFWFSYRDRGTDPADAFDLFGLVTYAFAPKGRALDAFVNGVRGS